MRFFWTLFWTFLLVEMLTYVVSSMSGVEVNFATGGIVSIIVTVLILIATTIIPKEPVQKH
ncbi:YjzD family protein [Neobacillus muris]|uniref:YjzD family protein n=1 Tax=Neobacillus muris TaxID=2941334 RepID=UPI00203C71F9|nr:YjzD family protein [Neobacillus muris]